MKSVNSPRILPEQLVQHYKQSGISPTIKEIAQTEYGLIVAGCGLGATGIALGFWGRDHDANNLPSGYYDVMFDAFGEEYVLGFMTGFDGGFKDNEGIISNDRPDIRSQGYRDGFWGARLVKQELAKQESEKAERTEAAPVGV